MAAVTYAETPTYLPIQSAKRIPTDQQTPYPGSVWNPVLALVQYTVGE